MLRSLQLKVNKRTTDYGKQYTGEQADDAKIQEELRGLADRQVKIHKATKDIATSRAGGGLGAARKLGLEGPVGADAPER